MPLHEMVVIIYCRYLTRYGTYLNKAFKDMVSSKYNFQSFGVLIHGVFDRTFVSDKIARFDGITPKVLD